MSISGPLRRFVPLFDRVLIQRSEALQKTKGGIVIPEKAQSKVLEGTVVAAGPGGRNDKGDQIPLSVAVGDQVLVFLDSNPYQKFIEILKVLLPEFGGTKIEIDGKEYSLFRESDLVAKFSKE